MYWILIPITSYFVAMLIAKKYPNLAPHIAFSILSATGLLLALVVRLTFYPQIESLYASLDEQPIYIVSPNILFVGSLIFYGTITVLPFLSKRFQTAFDSTFRNRWSMLALILLILMVSMIGYVVVVLSPLHAIANEPFN